MQKPIANLIWPMSLCLALSSCGAGDGTNLDENGNPSNGQIIQNPEPQDESGDQENSNESSVVTLAELQEDIFGSICSLCHTGSGAPQGLRLDSEQNSFNFLVNVDSNQVPSLKRVLPGDPDNSYLVQKIEGQAGIVGGQMPLNLDPLSATDIQRIRDWIANGAPQTGAGTASTKVSNILEDNNASHLEIQLHFNRTLDSESIDHDDFLISTIYENYSNQLSSDQFQISTENKTVTLELAHHTIENAEALELIVQDPRFSTIYDSQGRMLDGNNNEFEGGSKRHVITF